MQNKLQTLFPQIRTRQQVLDDILKRENLKENYEKWEEETQENFLDICSGARGVKMLYDSFFKEIFNPDTVPERLEELLSLLLKQNVTILKVLPNDSSRIAAENSLLIMDIVVELEDGSIANVECQKSGYKFQGQRAACYSADLLLRQYKRVRGKAKKAFTYKEIKKVYSIIFYEQSPAAFHAFPDDSIHRSKQQTNTGLEMNLLQEFLFIPLDIVQKIYQNKGIRNKLEAWFIFLSSEDPETIAQLLDLYPEFRELYEDVYNLCLDTERMMGMFSKELLELDRNTVQYMIDEMQEDLDAKKKLLAEREQMLADQNQLLADQNQLLAERDQLLANQDQLLAEKDKEIAELKARLVSQG